MREAPERIWKRIWAEDKPVSGSWSVCKDFDDDVEYIRADLVEAKLAKAVQAMQEAIKLADMPHYGDREAALDNCFDAIVLLRTTLSELNGDKP